MTIQEMKKMFIKLYGGDESNLRIFESPGRVNLIGEHIDYGNQVAEHYGLPLIDDRDAHIRALEKNGNVLHTNFVENYLLFCNILYLKLNATMI